MASHNLQGQSTSFIGRQAELTEIAAMLADPNCRLLTLVGPGGIGKTRLAIETAARTAHTYPDGVYFVDLQPVNLPESIVSTIGEAISFSFSGQEDPLNQLLYHLQSKAILLVFDNFEHLLAGIELLMTIVENTPTCQLLVTSREVLNLQVEWVFDVSGMPFPQNEQVKDFEDYGAVSLFVERARRARSDFSPEREAADIVRICQLTQGMPLAIELATSWLRTLSCAEIASELQTGLELLKTSMRDMPERHRSIQAAFDQSWKYLRAEERDAFMRLSIFRGGFQREAAKEIADIPLTTLATLVDKSLLRMDNQGRYYIHELLRQFAEEKLNAHPDDHANIHGRHCEYYGEFLRQREDAFWAGNEEGEVLQEIDNIRAAWRWAVSQEMFFLVRKLAVSLLLIHEVQSWWQEAATIYAWAVGEMRRDDNNAERAKTLGLLLLNQSHFYRRVGLVKEGKALGQQGLVLLQHTEPDEAHAWAYVNLTRQGMPEDRAVLTDHEKVKQLLLQGLAIFEKSENQRGITWTLLTLGNVILDYFDHEQQGQQYYQQALELTRQMNDNRGKGWALWGLSRIARRAGEYEKARDYLREYLSLGKETGARQEWYLTYLGEVEFELGNYHAASQLFCEKLKIAVDRPYMRQQRLEGLVWLCRLLVVEGMVSRAVEILVLIRHHSRGHDQLREQASDLLDECKAELSQEIFVAAIKRGQQMDIDATIAQLLEWFQYEQDEGLSKSTNQSLVEPLTERELEILNLIVGGLANKEIASHLIIGVSTVKKHISHIYGKLGVKNRTQAVARARELDLL